MQTRSEELRAQIRTQKASLVSDARLPSMAAIQERLALASLFVCWIDAGTEMERFILILNELRER